MGHDARVAAASPAKGSKAATLADFSGWKRNEKVKPIDFLFLRLDQLCTMGFFPGVVISLIVQTRHQKIIVIVSIDAIVFFFPRQRMG